jgi:hypothetical protein
MSASAAPWGRRPTLRATSPSGWLRTRRLNWENVTGFIPRISREQWLTTTLAGLLLHMIGWDRDGPSGRFRWSCRIFAGWRRVWDSNPR